MTDPTAARRRSGGAKRRGVRRVPARSRVRRAILWVHLWTSLVVGVFILAVTLSGTALVFRDYTDRYVFHPELYRETPGETSIEDAHAAVEEAYPGMRAENVVLPGVAGGVYRVDLVDGDGSYAYATVDPGTGEVLGDEGDPYKDGFNGWMSRLHFYLFAGEVGLTEETGVKVVGVVGIALLVVLLTGVYLWWPGLRRWAAGFRVRWRGDRYARNHDYHKVIGIVTVPMLALIALTGATFGFHETSRSVWYAVTFADPPPEYPETPPKVGPAPGGPLSLDELAARVADRMDAQPTWVGVPEKEDEAAMVYLSAGWDPYASYNAYDGNVAAYADPYTGEVLWEQDPREMTLAARAFELWLFPAHVGSFGRLPVRVLWALVGLAPTALAVTGLTMWLLKRRAARRRKGRREKAVS